MAGASCKLDLVGHCQAFELEVERKRGGFAAGERQDP